MRHNHQKTFAFVFSFKDLNLVYRSVFGTCFIKTEPFFNICELKISIKRQLITLTRKAKKNK